MEKCIPLIFPLIINYRTYRKTGIFDYLLISLYFFIWSILVGSTMFYVGFDTTIFTWRGFLGEIAILDWFFYKFMYIIIDTFDAFPLFVVALRAKYSSSFKKLPVFFKVIGVITIFLTIIALFAQYQIQINPLVPNSELNFLILCFNRLTFHSCIVYAFITCKWEETPRARISRIIWIIGSLIWILALIYFFILVFIVEFENNIEWLPFAIFIIPIAVGYGFLLINNVFYPESVLFTHPQIGRSLKFYSRVEEVVENNPDRGMNYLKQYLDSIPEDILMSIANMA